MTSGKLRIHLMGPFRITGPNNEDLTLKSAKQQAVIALLATAPGMRKPRRWVESKLWCHSDPKQAHASMRGAISQIKKLLGPYGDVLDKIGADVFLDQSRIWVDVLSGGGEQRFGEEFLEGIHIADEEWTDWLRMMRTKYAPGEQLISATATKPILVGITCSHSGNGNEEAERVGEFVTRTIASSISEQVRATIREAKHSPSLAIDTAGPTRQSLHVESVVIDKKDDQRIFIKVLAGDGRVIFYRTMVRHGLLDDIYDDTEIGATNFLASESVLDFATSSAAETNPVAAAAKIGREAIRMLFDFSMQDIERADRLLRKAHDLDPNPVFLAWRAFIKNVNAIEEPLSAQHAVLVEEARQLSDRALRDGYDNALVLSLCSLVQVMMFDDSERAMDLARAAMLQNPGSAFALQALGMAHVVNGNPAVGIEYSRRSHQIATYSAFGHWWDLVHCFACIAAQEFDTAQELAKAAARKAPNFRPPQRALVAMFAKAGKVDDANRVKRHLEQIEPGFSLARFLEDKDYPNRTLRMAGLLDWSSDTIRRLES